MDTKRAAPFLRSKTHRPLYYRRQSFHPCASRYHAADQNSFVLSQFRSLFFSFSSSLVAFAAPPSERRHHLFSFFFVFTFSYDHPIHFFLLFISVLHTDITRPSRSNPFFVGSFVHSHTSVFSLGHMTCGRTVILFQNVVQFTTSFVARIKEHWLSKTDQCGRKEALQR